MDYVTACQQSAWSIETWPVDQPEERVSHTFRCRSWRCQGECRQWKGAQDFARIKIAMESREHWCHMVMTYRHGAGQPTAKTFRECVLHWSKFRKRLTREYGEIKYIQTWEVHRSLWPHCHIAISNPFLQKACAWHPKTNWIKLLLRSASECGFGYVGWLEPIRSTGQMAGYLSKVFRELTGTGKDYQIPLNAPKNFRRLRASVRLLPPPIKNPDITGMLHFCQCDGEILPAKSKRDTQ